MDRVYGHWMHAHRRRDDPGKVELLVWDISEQWSRMSGPHSAWLAELWGIPIDQPWTGLVEWRPMPAARDGRGLMAGPGAGSPTFWPRGDLTGLITLSGVMQHQRVLLDLTHDSPQLVRMFLRLTGLDARMEARAWTPAVIPECVQLAVEAHHRPPATLDRALRRGRKGAVLNVAAGPAAVERQ